MYRFCLLFIFASFAFFVSNQSEAQTTIYLIRHAEKTSDKDPVLNDAGKQRANKLARILRSANLTACYSTQFKRTQLTAQPTANAANLKVQVHRAGDEAKLLKQLNTFSENNPGVHQRILIVGHSNTVPVILQLCGEENPPTLEEDDYDNLFVIHLNDSGNVVLQTENNNKAFFNVLNSESSRPCSTRANPATIEYGGPVQGKF